MRTPALLLTAAVLALPGAAAALDYRSLNQVGVMYDTPSVKGKKLWVVHRGTPVEAIISLDQWVKVRDAAGSIAWIERKALSATRTLIVTAASAEVHQKADATSPVAFTAGRDLVLEFVDKSSTGWVRVKHRDGVSGYIRATDVWGE
ncbi:SH3 domain-containing protein [Niveibacterium terrae]|uniref:SH3 domain-containing protein n=1 Tax=Niveibacterium terrae TaxID=3373598 RepID=UPI003A938172